MNKNEQEKILDFGEATSFFITAVEYMLEDYECEGALTAKQLDSIKRKISVVRKYEKDFKKVLGVE